MREKPQVTRNAYQRLYDMIISYGTEEYIDNKKKLVRYNFFKDEQSGGANAIFGLDIPLMRLVHVLKAASEGYGPEKRVILLHGPVGSSKSTIARLLKQGVEQYSRSPDGALYTFEWVEPRRDRASTSHERRSLPEPDERGAAARSSRPSGAPRRSTQLGLSNDKFKVRVDGDMDPASRFIFKALMQKYEGDWAKMVPNHIRVKRLVL